MLEDESHGPELCLGGVALSLPPQCGGVPLVGWDWDAVDVAQSGSGTTMGEFHVVGTYEDGILTVTEVGPAEPDRLGSGTIRSFATSCPEPAGGWPAVESGVALEEDFAAGASIAQARPDHVALWVDYAGDLTPEEVDQMMVDGEPVAKIMNVVVTGEVAETEAAIRKVWHGPLCVVQHEGRTQKELQAIRAEAERFIQEELGLEIGLVAGRRRRPGRRGRRRDRRRRRRPGGPRRALRPRHGQALPGPQARRVAVFTRPEPDRPRT